MRKAYRVGAAGSGSIARVVGLLCILAAGLGIATDFATTRALAPGRPSASKPAAASGDAAGDAGSVAGDVNNLDASDDGSSRQSRAGGSESLLSGIANASGPVVVVTLVIAVDVVLLDRTRGLDGAQLSQLVDGAGRTCCETSRTCWTRRSTTKPTIGWWAIRRSWRGCLLPGFASFHRASLRPSAPASSRTKAPQWRWSTARPIWPRSERSGR